MHLARSGPLALLGVVLAHGAALRADEGASPAAGMRATDWDAADFGARRDAVVALSADYLAFLSANKTEREVVTAVTRLARERGFQPAPDRGPVALRPGERRVFARHGKIVALVVGGTRAVSDGVRIVGAHVDSVRIDLKQNPVYADANLALLQTHYYGTPTLRTWLSVPLELRGVVVKPDARVVDVRIGDDPSDPVLVVPDLQDADAENLDAAIGSVPAALRAAAPAVPPPTPPAASTPERVEDLRPFGEVTPRVPAFEDRLRQGVLALLKSQLDLDPEDLASAELQLVPAGAAREVGIDRGLVGGYGQDGRAGVFMALRALLDVETPEHTAIVLFADKEEIGAVGNTGARSSFLPNVVGRLLAGQRRTTEHDLREALAASRAIAADATAAAHPQRADAVLRRNAFFLGSGVALPQTGARAELVRHVWNLLRREDVPFQTGSGMRGPGTHGGETTLLAFLAALGVDAAELSVPVLSMHTPFEIASKVDLHAAYRAYREFLKS